jgi:nucleoid-associated protein YgaU
MVVFADSQGEYRSTSGRTYQFIEGYHGKYKGQSMVNEYFASGWEEAKLTRDLQELMSRVLDTYVTESGDTYWILAFQRYGGVSYVIICEFTSTTRYNYWVIEK